MDFSWQSRGSGVVDEPSATAAIPLAPACGEAPPVLAAASARQCRLRARPSAHQPPLRCAAAVSGLREARVESGSICCGVAGLANSLIQVCWKPW